MKLKSVMELKVLAKNKENIKKPDGTVYTVCAIAFIQGTEMGTLSVPEKVFESILPDAVNVFDMQYYEGIINGSGIKSFKIVDVIPMPPSSGKVPEVKLGNK